MSAEEHIGVVSGLADFANFMAALGRGTEPRTVRTILFGESISLPEGLVSDFNRIVRLGFPTVELIRISADCFKETESVPIRSMPSLLRRSAIRRIIYGNAIHKPAHQALYKNLAGDDFVFFDNGLSSYAPHEIDFRSAPRPSVSCLTLAPPLFVPAYLSGGYVRSLVADDYGVVFEKMRLAADKAPSQGFLPETVILGTSLFRTGKIDWNVERSIYLQLIKSLGGPSGSMVFKPHPRSAANPLITPRDGIEILDSSVPVEAFVKPGTLGCAYSISSTSLITLAKFYGWTCARLSSPAADAVIASSPHLQMVKMVPELEKISLA